MRNARIGRVDVARWTAFAVSVLFSTRAPAAGDDRCWSEEPIPGAYVSACMADSSRRFAFAGTGTLIIEQGSVGPGSTGAAVWRAGEFMAGYLVANPSLVRGKRVIELGCGTGLCGLVAARLGASRVLLTDGSDTVLERARRNIALNRLGSSSAPGSDGTLSTRTLLWGGLVAEELRSEFDVVLASDVLYFTGAWRPLSETVHELLSPTGQLLLAEAGHDHLPAGVALAGFRSVAEPCGLRFYEGVTESVDADVDKIDSDAGGNGPAIARARAIW